MAGRLDFATLLIGEEELDELDGQKIFEATFGIRDGFCICNTHVAAAQLPSVRDVFDAHHFGYRTDHNPEGAYLTINFGDVPLNVGVDRMLAAYEDTPTGQPRYWLSADDSGVRGVLCARHPVPTEPDMFVLTQREGLVPRYGRLDWARFAERLDGTNLTKAVFTDQHSAEVMLTEQAAADFLAALITMAGLFDHT